MKNKRVIMSWLKKNYDADPIAFNKMVETIVNDNDIAPWGFLYT